jgi:hypothetical protein
MFASQSGAAWNKQALPQSGDDTNLAVDSKDNLHTLTTSNTSKKFGPMLWYTSKAGSYWNIQTVDEGEGGSLALDSASNPHVAYCDNGRSLQYSKWTDKGWVNQTVDNTKEFDGARSLVLDGKGNPHILYSYTSQNETELSTVRYAEWNNQTGWRTQTVISNISYRSCGNMVLDSNNNPHFTFAKQNRDNTTSLMYASLVGSVWRTQTVATNLNWQSAESAALALDANNRPHITYLSQRTDAATGNFTYAEWNGAAWNVEVIDPSGCSTGPILLDSAGNPHVSYLAYGETENNLTCLMYATSSRASSTAMDGALVFGAAILVVSSAIIVITGLLFGKRKTEDD